MSFESTERRLPRWQALAHALFVGGITALLVYTIGYIGWVSDNLEELRTAEKTLPRLEKRLLEVRSAQKSHPAFLQEIERLDLEHRKMHTVYFPENPAPFLETLVPIADESGIDLLSVSWSTGSATTRSLSLKVSSKAGLPQVIDFLRAIQLSDVPARIEQIEFEEGSLSSSSNEIRAELSITFYSLPPTEES